MICSECGARLRRESMFCLNCGIPVDAQACYIAELKDSGKALVRKTDKDSLNNIISLTKKIYAKAEGHDELKLKTRDIFEHYLPMLTEVISRYKEANKHSNLKGDMKAVKDDLTEVLDTTERAFEIALEELCEKDIDELIANIEVLKNKIARDGLLDSDFDISE